MQPTLSTDTIARAIGRRLSDAEIVRSCRAQVTATARYPAGWDVHSVAMGPLGSALVFEALSTAGSATDEWSDRADAVLEESYAAVSAAREEHDSLFGGTPGTVLAYVTATTRDPHRWRERTRTLADDVADRVLSGEPPPPSDDLSDADYDLISGRAGVLMALSSAREVFPDSGILAAATNRVFDDLHDLLRRGERVGDGAVIAPHHYPLPEYAEEFPSGYLNLGLAHGMPGILLALSTVETRGERGARRLSLIRDLAARILDSADVDEFGLTWSTGVASPTPREPRAGHGARAPHAWCYGAPGVALALHHAGAALRDRALARRARTIMHGALARHPEPDAVRSPTICHGLAGVLACADSVLGASPDPESVHGSLRTELLRRADLDAPLLYRDVEEPAQLLDDPSVIQGAAGVALVLAERDDRAPRSPWRYLFGF